MKSGNSFSFIFSEGNRSEVEYYTFYKSMTDRQMVEERGRRREAEQRGVKREFQDGFPLSQL